MTRRVYAMLLLSLSVNSAAAADHLVPEIPPPEVRMRINIDTDAAGEIDDLYAIALALLCPERFDIEGLWPLIGATPAGPTASSDLTN